MNKKIPLILISLAFITVILLFKFGKFGTSQNFGMEENNNKEQAPITIKWDDVETKTLQSLDAKFQNEYQAINNNTKSETEKIQAKMDFWGIQKNVDLYGHFLTEKSLLEKSEKGFTFATPLLIDILTNEEDPKLKNIIADDIIALSDAALAKFPQQKNTWDFAKANALIEGKTETMQGVQLLLAITKEDPTNLKSNLLLGKMALQSQQYQKGIDRLEKLLEHYPENSEAMYFLAEAYKGIGNKEKAVFWFEKCKSVVNNKEFSSKIDEYIKNI